MISRCKIHALNDSSSHSSLIAAGLVMVMGIASSIGGIALAQTSTTNPFGSISERNAFGLKSPIVKLSAGSKQNLPEIEVKLTGIVTFFSKPKVLLSTKDPGSVGPVFHSLAEGERTGELEILEIDAQKEQVKILLLGEIKILNFKDQIVPAGVLVSSGPEESVAPTGNEATSPRRKLYRELEVRPTPAEP